MDYCIGVDEISSLDHREKKNKTRIATYLILVIKINASKFVEQVLLARVVEFNPCIAINFI